jgi:hypothetical protein
MKIAILMATTLYDLKSGKDLEEKINSNDKIKSEPELELN